MNQRFFRSDEATYETIRTTLDESWGLPNASGTVTCIQPAATAPVDSHGRIMLSVAAEFCGYSVAAEMLPQLLASGAVEEISESEYRSAAQSPSPVI